MTLEAEEDHSASFHNFWDPLHTPRCPRTIDQILGSKLVHSKPIKQVEQVVELFLPLVL